MEDSHHPPLSYEPSATTTHPHIATTLPTEVVSCLKNSRFLHLATCDNSIPHISLMSYTYLPSTPFSPLPTIIMTTNPSSKKTLNLHANPRLSLLVHDWVSHRPPTYSREERGASPPPPAASHSSLATLLLNINTSALSSISTTIIGEARFLDQGSEEEKWCKERHLENNTFGSGASEEPGQFGAQQEDSSNNVVTVAEDARVVTVTVKQGRIADWKGGVRDWTVVSEEEARRGLVNGEGR
ncbi:hypothetical protein FQN54_004378 [Arachnomyces sp. PD_36]|nr:hypothetical protein FQN54_004378 [Arachnomyces sp. PD_36]